MGTQPIMPHFSEQQIEPALQGLLKAMRRLGFGPSDWPPSLVQEATRALELLDRPHRGQLDPAILRCPCGDLARPSDECRQGHHARLLISLLADLDTWEETGSHSLSDEPTYTITDLLLDAEDVGLDVQISGRRSRRNIAAAVRAAADRIEPFPWSAP